MIKSTFLLLIFLISIGQVNAQISNSNAKPEGEKVKAKKEKVNKVKVDDTLVKTNLYINIGYINSFRSFTDETASNYFSEWEKQTPLNSFSLGAGVYIPLINNLDLEIGGTFANLGEQYMFQDSLSDSTYHYVNKFKHAGVALRLKYAFGSANFKPYVFGGVIPTSIFKLRYESEYNSADGNFTENPITTTTNKLADFNLVLSGGAGVIYMSRNVGFSVYGEYRHNLMNTYSEYKVQHKLYGFNISVGFHVKI